MDGECVFRCRHTADGHEPGSNSTRASLYALEESKPVRERESVSVVRARLISATSAFRFFYQESDSTTRALTTRTLVRNSSYVAQPS